eukprot:6450817-Prymnesium_polylepis.1
MLADASSICPHLKPVLFELGLGGHRRALEGRRVTLTRLRTGMVGEKELKACGLSADETMALLLATTSSKQGWMHAPNRAQSISEWDSLLRRFGLGLEHYATTLATSRRRAQSLAVNALTDAELVAAGVKVEDAARLRRCARIYHTAAKRLALDLVKPRAPVPSACGAAAAVGPGSSAALPPETPSTPQWAPADRQQRGPAPGGGGASVEASGAAAHGTGGGGARGCGGGTGGGGACSCGTSRAGDGRGGGSSTSSPSRTALRAPAAPRDGARLSHTAGSHSTGTSPIKVRPSAPGAKLISSHPAGAVAVIEHHPPPTGHGHGRSVAGAAATARRADGEPPPQQHAPAPSPLVPPPITP